MATRTSEMWSGIYDVSEVVAKGLRKAGRMLGRLAVRHHKEMQENPAYRRAVLTAAGAAAAACGQVAIVALTVVALVTAWYEGRAAGTALA